MLVVVKHARGGVEADPAPERHPLLVRLEPHVCARLAEPLAQRGVQRAALAQQCLNMVCLPQGKSTFSGGDDQRSGVHRIFQTERQDADHASTRTCPPAH